MINRRPKFTETLPPTPCTKDQSESVRSIAESEKVSIATIIRNAIDIFLETYDPKASE